MPQNSINLTIPSDSITNLNEDYSQKLAIFMKNSNKLLKNMNKAHNSVNNKEVNNNEIDIFNNSQSPNNYLREFEDKLVISKYTDKKMMEVDDSKYTTYMKDALNLNGNMNNSENVLNTILKTSNAKHNFQEALHIDDLESQMNKLQKQLNEKNKLIEELKSELLIVKQKYIHKNRVYQSLATEYYNDFPTCSSLSSDQDYKVRSEEKIGQNKEKYSLEFSSIEDYNPNSSIALKNKIKDLESQIQDLQEANEVASLIVSNFKNEESIFHSNEIFLDLITKNQLVQDEVRNLYPDANETKSNVLQNELNNLKKDICTLKQNNIVILEENIKLKNFVMSCNCNSNNNQNNESLNKLQSDFDLLNKSKKHSLYPTKPIFEKSQNLLNNENCFPEKYNMKLNNDSTDSMLSDQNAGSIKFVNDLVSIKISKDDTHALHDDECDNIKFCSNGILKNKNYDAVYIEDESNYLSKFSTFGRIAFAPRSASDISINDVIKFIRQGGRISKGIVHFIGHLPKRNDVYLGIELEIEEGKHNGIYEGIRYFQCRENKGVFVAFNKIIMVYSKNAEYKLFK